MNLKVVTRKVEAHCQWGRYYFPDSDKKLQNVLDKNLWRKGPLV